MIKKILVLGGGISKERLISLQTAKAVNKELKKKYKTLVCEIVNFYVGHTVDFLKMLIALAIMSFRVTILQ